MTIDISNNNPRISYSVSSGATITEFAVPFEFFDDSDLDVYIDDVLKSITTDYSVSGGDGSTGTVTMSVTGAAGGSTVVITRDITIERTTDFTAGIDINRAALNTQLDTLTAIAAGLKDGVDRSLKLSDTDTAGNLDIPDINTRKGTVLGFNATTGNPEAGPQIADVQSLANITADIATLADIQDGTVATNALTTLSAISSDVATVSSISANVTTVAGNASNVNTVAGISADVTTVASVSSGVSTLAPISANITTAAGIAADISTVASDSADIRLVADNLDTIGEKATVDEAISFGIALG